MPHARMKSIRKLVATLGIVAGLSPWQPARAADPGHGVHPVLPQVGDVLTYAVSNGDAAEARVVSVSTRGDRTYAEIVQKVTHSDGSTSESRFRWVRTDDAVALDMPPAGDNARLTPLVYFLAIASPHDTWVAQQGAFRDADGDPVKYQLVAELEAIETIHVRGGTFPGCYRIAYKVVTKDGPPATRMLVWFKPEVGIVQTRSVQGDRITETQLTSFSHQGLAAR